MKRLSEAQFTELVNLTNNDPQEAMRILSIYEREYATDENLQENLGGFLIDIGSTLPDITVIQRGVNNIEQKRKENNDNLDCTQWYNLGNGYYALEAIKRGTGYEYNPTHTTMVQAKQCYRKAILGSNHMKSHWKAKLNVNYANSLAELGRSVEAISQYNVALQYNSEHPLALGNLGKELEKFAYIASDSNLLADAHQFINHALSGNLLEEAGYSYARLTFKNYKLKIEEQIQKIKNTQPRKHNRPQVKVKRHKDFIDFCTQHGLFLNFCLKGQKCNHPYEDTIGFSMVTPIDENALFHRLARTINEIKEQYAVARLLLFEAVHSPYKTKFYDTLTPYNNLLDYSVYGVRPAKLKVAFETSYNLLDKIALFINNYLNLGMSDDASGFFSIWKKQPKDISLRQEIIQCDNIHLYGLYDIARDLSRDGYLLHLKSMRDTITHKYLIPHISRDGKWYVESDNEQYHIGYKEFLEHSITLMQVVRAAVIYLVAFISQEENKRMQKSKNKIADLGGWFHEPETLGPDESLA